MFRTVPVLFRNLSTKFADLLAEAGKQATTSLVLFIDGVDHLEDIHSARTMQWIPEVIPQVCIFLNFNRIVFICFLLTYIFFAVGSWRNTKRKGLLT